ncbi:succinate dehydrogenase assembly factor 2 [Candidatus Pelagibacter sp.]|nr:succinate dehydrogenase assembly factor 2 [Candidatus Pelagibacter sp.]
MSQNLEEIKKKIIYRSSYRGTKEMDLLMTDFVKSIINDLKFNELICLNEFIELDDEILKSLKNKESINNFNPKLNFILEKFQKF